MNSQSISSNMPAVLDPEEIKKFYTENMPRIVLEGIKRLEKTEDWALDKPGSKFLSVLQNLASFVEQSPTTLDGPFQNEDLPDIIQALAYARTSHALRILGLASHSQPGLGGEILRTCMEMDRPEGALEAESKVMLARIRLLARLECYDRIFGPETRKRILNIIAKMKEAE